MKKSWSSLPNAQYIDWVLKSLKENPKLWHEAWRAVWDAARFAAWVTAWNKARDAARHAALDAAGDAAWLKSRDNAGDAAWDALIALIAYDDCNQYLALGYEKLKVYATLSEKPQAILLLPMLYVRENLHMNALKYNGII